MSEWDGVGGWQAVEVGEGGEGFREYSGVPPTAEIGLLSALVFGACTALDAVDSTLGGGRTRRRAPEAREPTPALLGRLRGPPPNPPELLLRRMLQAVGGGSV